MPKKKKSNKKRGTKDKKKKQSFLGRRSVVKKLKGFKKKIFKKPKLTIPKGPPKLNEKNIKRIIFFSVLIGSFTWLFWGIPLPTRLGTDVVPVSTKLYDRNGELIYEIYADQKSTPVNLEDLPEHVKNSTIATEDKDFYEHYGVSFTGVMRAAYSTVFKRDLQGGSTLTQQLVKNALLTPERTIKRKIRELALTLIVETIYSKDKILELYLNQIPYGGTAYGIGAAAEAYFDKDAKDLTLSEAALLAGLPAAPSRYSPFGSRPELAKGRQETVLRRMTEEGYITQEEADAAKSEELNFAEPEPLTAPHFALWVKELLAEKYGESVVERGGLRVTTTLDLELQRFAQETVAEELEDLNDNLNIGNGAALVTRPSTGEILAMVGSKDYYAEDEDGKVNIIFARRQPGSSIKPINYVLALEEERITAATPIADVPTCFRVAGQAPYCPRNYDGGFHGLVQARFALGNSYNIPAVKVVALNGVENFIEFANRMGITTFTDPSNYGLSITLGGGEVMPYDMATAFGTLANGGTKQPLNPFLEIKDWQGNVLEEPQPEQEEERVLSQAASFIVSHILHDNNARSAAFGSSSLLNVSGHPEVSVKTGTTNDLRDNWTIGYTRHALTVVWVGNNDNSQMSGAVSGVSGASPIWNTIMEEVLDKAEQGTYSEEDDGHGWPLQPDSIEGANVCNTIGVVPQEGRISAGCETRYEYFIDGTIPTEFEGGVQNVEFHTDTGGFINEDTPPDKRRSQPHSVVYDPLGTFYCLDCPIPASSQSAEIRYPLRLEDN